jgi:phosphoheptose isomerase
VLKLPKSATKLIKDKLEQSKNVKILEDNHVKKTKMIEIQQKEIININASCTYCRNVLLEDSKVFQCGNCGSYYHEVCLNKMHNEIGSCRFCGSVIMF